MCDEMQQSVVCVQQTIDKNQKLNGPPRPKLQLSLRIHVTFGDAFCDAFFPFMLHNVFSQRAQWGCQV